ncbi:tRNA (uracil-5-)-methyltransferase like A [Pseudolycoriella hygida]|uniref:tRNA (uracil(54)-C(5))-methyltransferase n=1 Tax=Pseudolycoriella hygida TaxID=35572 RepID=A0A9Q0N9L7_9DIPT|nr:tRNA (uracil-5-)-methyltransferase like A [Pseudolycoriella hygida]
MSMDSQEKMDISVENSAADQSVPAPASPTIEQPTLEERKDFTSEIFKIEIKNLARFGFGEIKKFLKKKMQLDPVKIKAMPRSKEFGHHAFLCFRSEKETLEAIKKLDGAIWKGQTIKALPAKAIMDPMQKKRLEKENGEDVQTVRKTCLEATAPLAHLTYDEQLAIKEVELKKILEDYRKQILKVNPKLGLLKDIGIWNGFERAPLINGYRNKSEFTVGKNVDGEKVVGFRLGSYSDGSVEVGDISDLPHIPERMKLAAKLCQDFIRASPYDVFSPEFYTGVFRQISVRFSSVTDELMLVIGVHMSHIKDELIQDVVTFFTETGGAELKAKSIYIEKIMKRQVGQKSNEYIHIHGEKYITEIVHGLKFRISPGSFFQVNTQSAEVLYQCAINLAATTPETTVLDICCGTGTIGLCFSKYCKEVLGVELVAEAINDARYNATANGITNCEFFAGNCDDYIQTLVHKATGNNILAVVDPPRAGLHNRSVTALRNVKGLDRFIYISCSPTSALRNWVDLARPLSKTYKGNPFIAKCVMGVDMFPHTQHKEMIILFERIKDNAPLNDVTSN